MLHVLDDAEDVGRGLAQGLLGALVLGDDLLPVPLVHIARVQVVELLVAADGVHVGVDALAGAIAVLAQRHALPLGKRLDHLDVLLGRPRHVEAHGTLHAVEVVVEAGALEHEERRRHAGQIHLAPQFALERVTNVLDCLLRLADGHLGVVPLGKNQAHKLTHLSCSQEQGMQGIVAPRRQAGAEKGDLSTKR